ncbi:uncharacterized protein N7500_007558 [Penicillium coprophilum]|uniref:uncharacterized protein n=1 Tax=Penicillium coprophilum TaxID=36646 RepID=UPI00239E1D4F|nr:uncharacterized protein N7500_005318 [Penicillium coprophilum]XP_056533702.1 uncharacterized protein N7500_007558 [Penicillium coprophilum]KAJ5163488.1 hypothetical protein N7500_005318 [Penicillium coprophilum]KAJ5165728.1 hypothetical protein N7500_007558 [Penicillium coprophilum]
MAPADLAHRPKSQLTEKLQRSTKNLVGRSTAMWDDSRYRYHQSTMELWHRSADTLNDSKDRCQRSAKSMLYRSVSKWNQSADQLYRAARIEDTEQHVTAGDGKTQEPMFSQSRFYSRALNSQPISPSQTPDTTSPSTKVRSIKSVSVTVSSLSPDKQIEGLYEATELVNSTVGHTRDLRDDKRTALGEIELEWIDSTITEAENAVNDLASFVKHFRQTRPQAHRSWKRRDYGLALKKESRMLLSHDKLETVLGHLDSLPSTSSKDESFFSPSEVSMVTPAIPELSSETSVISVFELPGLNPVKNERPVPKIIVTQHDGDHDDNIIYSHIDESPPPSYEVSGMNSPAELP